MNSSEKKLTDCYEVELTMRFTVFVKGAESEDKAIEYAEEELAMGAGDVIEARVQQLREHEVESSRRHADLRNEP